MESKWPPNFRASSLSHSHGLQWGKKKQSDQDSNREENELLQNPQGKVGPKPLIHVVLHEKTDELEDFLLQNYREMELTPKAEMLHSAIQGCQEHFPLIFRKVFGCL